MTARVRHRHTLIVVVTQSKDVSADLVIRHLQSDSANYLRLDTDLLGTNQRFFGLGSEPELHIDGATYASSQVSAVWARRFALPRSLQSIEPQYREFTRREMGVVMDAFLEGNSAIQINPYMADRLAGNRLIQSQRAKACGLSVPATLVTQDPSKAREFRATHQDCITKALSFGRLVSPSSGAERVAYTSEVTSEADFANVATCPTLFQERLVGRYEWRVTTVRSSIFSARIELPSDQIDWRRKQGPNGFEKATLPDDVAQCILALCKVSDIVYGAHDLIEDSLGRFFFLETNPAGQWGWLEISLGFPIGRAIADELEKHND